MRDVLCIEDDKTIQSMLERLLRRKFGATALFVSNGEDAIIAIKQQPTWKLILSDWDLEGDSSGGDVFLWCLEKAPQLVQSYVFMSSNERAAALCRGAGLECLEKPVDSDRIVSTLSPYLAAA